MPWYVAWALTPKNGRLMWYLYPPIPKLAVGQKAAAFCHRVHRTVQCTTGQALCSVRCTPRQPIVGVCSSRPLDPTVTVCAHRTVRCRLSGAPPDSPVLQPEGACLWPLCADCPVVPPDSSVCTGQVLFSVRCATRRWLTALF
jgi:hypothetical protein